MIRTDVPTIKKAKVEAWRKVTGGVAAGLGRREKRGGEAQALGRSQGFDSDTVRVMVLDALDPLPVIPNRSCRKEPWPWDDEMRRTYMQRNRVERAFAKAKQFRRFATRYEKLKDV